MPSTKKLLQAAAGSAGGDNLYVEDVFSTNVYTGNGSTQTITNGIDLDGEGGLVWTKRRSGVLNHFLVTTDIATNQYLSTDLTSASGTTTTLLTPASDGFAFSSNTLVNANTASQVAWTFRKAEKFFDVVTYTGDATSDRQISHNLGSVPGLIIVKQTNFPRDWAVYHTSLGATKALNLNLTNSASTISAYWNNTSPTDTEFTVGFYNRVNNDSSPYVAYLFASDAGGFGDDGSENIIKCGTYTGNNASTANVIDVGFEPQWIMIKGTDRACNWIMVDVMRGATVAPSTSFLEANTSDAEATSTSGFNLVHPTATGFSIPSGVSGNVNEFNENYIYIAIRRPMKTPEAGTEIFDIAITEAASSVDFVTSPEFPIDFMWTKTTDYSYFPYGLVRLLGQTYHEMGRTFNEQSTSAISFDYQNKIVSTGLGGVNSTVAGDAKENTSYLFKRATGFFDVVAYTGTGSATTVTHNLGVAPELLIVRPRSLGNESLTVWNKTIADSNSAATLWLNSTSAVNNFSNRFNSTAPTDSVFSVADDTSTNGSSSTYVAFLFATLAGVSKVGSYSGTGSNINVDCGFSSGARMILIKRTDSTGSWYFWDSENGIVAGNDPYWINNSSAASVTTTDYIDPLSSGFTVTSSASADINTSGGTYIFLAIA